MRGIGTFKQIFSAQLHDAKAGRFGSGTISMGVHHDTLSYSPPETAKAWIRVLETSLIDKYRVFSNVKTR